MKTVLSLFAAIPLAASGHESVPPAGPAPEASGPSSDYVVRLEEMTAIQAGAGEKIHLLRGDEHGFRGLSFILTVSAPYITFTPVAANPLQDAADAPRE